MEKIDKRHSLIEACKRKNRKAQEQLYHDYADAMYNVCFRMIQNHADAQDVLQNAFIDIFNNLEKFKYQSTPGAWIKRIVVNNCINFFRSKKLLIREMQEYDGSGEIEDPFSEEDILEVGRVRNAMAHLPVGYRNVLSLYLFEGYDHKEISEILGIKVSTSKTQYFRAKIKLKNLLQQQAVNL